MTAPDTPTPADEVSPTTWAVVLAGGAGTRFGGPGHKLDAELAEGVSVAGRAIETAIAAGIGPVLVVTGAHRPVHLDRLLEPRPDRYRVAEVHNPDWASGQITSLQAGIAVARREGAEAVVVGLADQPGLTAGAWRAVAASRSPIAIATYDGETGHPVRLHRSVWDLLPTSGDEGARRLIRLRPDLVEPVACDGTTTDIDQLEDLERWQRN